jgi:hypothetical protein
MNNDSFIVDTSDNFFDEVLNKYVKLVAGCKEKLR